MKAGIKKFGPTVVKKVVPGMTATLGGALGPAGVIAGGYAGNMAADYLNENYLQ
uniref:Uncharacterized protein n=1 Tax=Meloidogyne hapla TaxID=6305 RepID=A0A1I8B6V6_MELHA